MSKRQRDETARDASEIISEFETREMIPEALEDIPKAEIEENPEDVLREILEQRRSEPSE